MLSTAICLAHIVVSFRCRLFRHGVEAPDDAADNKYCDFDPFEIACINNLNIMSVDEARCLVPSLNSLGRRVAQRLDPTGEGRVPPDFDENALIEQLLDDLRRFQNL
jgi:hypothetical protein